LSTRIRAILLVIVGLIILTAGIGAGLLLINRMNTPPAAQQAQVVKSPVVVLTRDMTLGEKISAADVSLYDIPVDVIPRDALSSLDAAIGKYIKSDTIQGEMVLQHNLADPTNNNHDLSFILSEDHILMAFPATDLLSQENLIQRGDVIDILATFQVSTDKLGTNPAPTPPPDTTAATNATNAQNDVTDFTMDAFQKVSVTALVLDVVTEPGSNNTSIGIGNQTANQPAAQTVQTSISSYLLALNPQDALVLKHLKDLGATFDVVLRSPTSTTTFDLTPVDEQYIIELYGLGVLP
jgi:Flp pilus assembly protein CpaB